MIDDPAEALDVLIEELRRQKASGVRHVSVSDASLVALKALAMGAASSPSPASSLRPPVAVLTAVGPKSAARAEAPAQLVIPPPPIFTIPPGTKAERMAALTTLIHACVETRRHLAAKQNPVVGAGSLSAKVLFVGDAPTIEEVESGKPFVGASGDLLQRILAATAIPAEDIFLVNVMGWRPEPPTVFGKRPPTVKELAFNHPYLKAQIEIVRPQVIVALGGQAFEALVGSGVPITQARGQWREFAGIPLMATFHPNYLLHNPSATAKRTLWEDFLLVMEKLAVPITEKQRAFFTASK